MSLQACSRLLCSDRPNPAVPLAAPAAGAGCVQGAVAHQLLQRAPAFGERQGAQSACTQLARRCRTAPPPWDCCSRVNPARPPHAALPRPPLAHTRRPGPCPSRGPPALQFLLGLLRQKATTVLDAFTATTHTIDPANLAHRIVQIRSEMASTMVRFPK